MTRCSMVLLTVFCLTGCAGWPEGGAGLGQKAQLDGWPDPSGGPYDFGWHLSGDRAVAPLQVFDDGRDTWLQFQAGQPLPALFGVRDGMQRLLQYRRFGPYVKVEGVWQELMLRGGALTAKAQYQGENQQGRFLSLAPPTQADGAGIADKAFVPLPSAPSSHPVAASPSPAAATSAATSTETSTETSTSTASVHFRATPADANIRRALVRWAKAAQWTFEPEHWTPDVDIPLAGSADFPPDFRQAVRQLLAATELSERPLQPCFYSNRVLRVVPLAQACDRTARHAGAAS